MRGKAKKHLLLAATLFSEFRTVSQSSIPIYNAFDIESKPNQN